MLAVPDACAQDHLVSPTWLSGGVCCHRKRWNVGRQLDAAAQDPSRASWARPPDNEACIAVAHQDHAVVVVEDDAGRADDGDARLVTQGRQRCLIRCAARCCRVDDESDGGLT